MQNELYYRELVYRLAREYLDRCEQYDRAICTHINPDGVAMPTSPHEHALVCIHAKKMFDELAAISDRTDLKNAINNQRRDYQRTLSDTSA